MFNKKLFEGINDELKNIDGREDDWIEKNKYESINDQIVPIQNLV